MTRWKDKSAITLAAADRLPVTDVSEDTDGWSTPEAVRTFVAENTSGIGIRRPIVEIASTVKGLLCAPPGISPSSTAQSAGRLQVMPFVAGRSVTVTDIGVYVGTASSASTGCRIGIYANRADGSGPAELLVDSGVITTDATGYRSATISQPLVAGTQYWTAVVFESTPSVSGGTASGSTTAPVGYQASTTSNIGYWFIWRSMSYGALPADESAQTYWMSGVAGAFVFYDF